MNEQQKLLLTELLQFVSFNYRSEFALRTVCELFEQRKFVEGTVVGPTNALDENQFSHEEWFYRFAIILRPSLRSPFSSVRQYALKLLFLLWPFDGYTSLDSNCSENKFSTNPIGMLLEAEQCEVSFQSYRQRAQLFRCQKRNSLFALVSSEDKLFQELMEKMVLDILFAQFYEQMTLYWPLLTETIESYAQSSDSFWESFGFALDFAWDALAEQNMGNGSEGAAKGVDFGSCRVQLLRLLNKLPSAHPELRTRYLTPKLITLYRGEFSQLDEPIHSTTLECTNDEEFIEKDEQNCQKEQNERTANSIVVKPLRFRIGRRSVVQAIKALLAVYGRFSNPKGVFREKEVIDIYYELLLVNEAEIQRAALGCLFTYKYQWLVPYRTQLEALLDPRQLRDQLVLFDVDNRNYDDKLDEHSLTDQHRPMLIPVLLRLLYGSLLTHVASRGKAKRLAIFRFLANCHSDELSLFLRLLFGPIFTFFEPNESDAVFDLEKALNILGSRTNVIQSVSLNKLKSSLGFLSDVFRFLGTFLSDSQLELLFASIVVISRILLLRSSPQQKGEGTQMEEDVLPPSGERFLKSLRKLLFLTLIQFFRAFQSRPKLPTFAFLSLFHHFLAPFIRQHNNAKSVTSDKCLSLPVSVVQLFCAWAQIKKYYPLLNVPLSIGIDPSIVVSPMALLCDQLSKHKNVMKLDILRVFCALLDSDNDNPSENECLSDIAAALPQLPLTMPETNAIAPSFGARLVLSNGQSDKILFHLTHFVNTDGEGKMGDQLGRIPTIYFDLLSRMVTFVNRPEFASLFARTLLRFVTFKNGLMLRRKPDRAVLVLATLERLVPHLADPLEAIDHLASLFSYLEGRPLRWALTQTAFAIRKNPSLPSACQNLIEQLEPLESWDTRRIEEPDADRRCEALLRLHDLYEQRDRHILLGVGAARILPLLAHSHVYSMLQQNSDISLRGTAANTFRQLIHFVAAQETANGSGLDAVQMLRSHFIPLILRGLRTSVAEESVRHEFVQCLATLVRCFPLESQLTQLRHLTATIAPKTASSSSDFVVDTDVDFFECAMHIQLHRRQRAFHRLAERLNNREFPIGHSSLVRFVVPIVEPYLLDTASNRSALSDQALHLFSSILRRTPWPKYCQMLDHFLHRLDTAEEESTKGAIRVIGAILNAFHFDLRHQKMGEEEKMEDDKEEEHEHEGEKEIPADEQTEMVQEEECQRAITKEDTGNEEEQQKILAVVRGRLLPRLRECLHRWSGVKKAGNNWDEEEQKLLRAPLTLAIVKVLEWLPPQMADQHLHGLVLFLNHLLMSRSPTTRQNARKLLEQMVCLLGPAKLPFMIREVKQSLKKGYQMHVMAVTVHALIRAMEGHLKNGDIEPFLAEVVDVCRWETFGGNAKINEKDGIAGGEMDRRSDSYGVPEARASGKKTSHTLTMVGRFVAKLDPLEQCVFSAIRDIANASSRSETMRKLSDWLRALNVGLRTNSTISVREQLRWALRLFDENLRLIKADENRMSQFAGNSSVGRRPSNCLLLPPEPKRLGVIQRVALKSKVHIFVEFALQILVDQLAKLRHLLPEKSEETGDNVKQKENERKMEENRENVKLEVVSAKSEERQQIVALLEQFMPLIIEALKQKYDKIIALSLRALLHLFKYSQIFWTSKERTTELVDRFFMLLADYSSVGNAEKRSHVTELQQQLFKCLTQVIRNISPTLLSAARLQLLFNYVETDILDVHKQTTAFNLLKAIIGQKIVDKNLSNVITYLSELAITSPSANIRTQCRQSLLLYLTVHPRGQRQYERWMEFFLNQCEYELEEGRLSALEMVHSIISEFTEEANARYALLVHLKLCVRLLNDDSVRCRQFVTLSLRRLFCSITPSAFNDCLAAANDWLAAKKPSVRLLAWRAFDQIIASGCHHFGPAKLKQIAQKACHSFSISTELFAEQLDAIKIALCDLLLSVANRTPNDLSAELLSSHKIQKVAFRRIRRKRSIFNEVDDEVEISAFTNRSQKTATLWPQFFVNLDHCLSRCQRNALHLPLSLSANSFLSKFIDQIENREEILRRLSNGKSINGQSSLDYSPLCSLCFNLIAQLDPKPPEKFGINIVKMDNECNGETEKEENYRQNCGGRWDDALAEKAVRLLAILMPSLSGAHFELNCKRLSKLCWAEAVKEPDTARKRLSILKLVGALAVNIPSVECEQFDHLCSYFVSIIYREINKKSSKFTEELHSLAMEVSAELRKRIGDREFTSKLAKCQRERSERISRRRSEAKTLFVTNPSAAIADKQRRHERKKEARRRKVDVLKPYRAMKRRRRTKTMEE